ncbi:histidine kinase N-terminal domain-containing protein [Alkalihalobacterium alkalinitrilicum]|uniref:histidine kinase N-terminal domain-containing protein n=1 Tax=Alkalihalobacterium alkalinitrilicum TaxID=427920 RepID=UPI000995BA31|nr:histidine kinase N-terminal domain-containing protein [Alkalihalobacterium alkalinitrilicum]
MVEVEDKFCHHLEKNEARFLAYWRKNIRISDSDPYNDSVDDNGKAMFELIVRSLKNPYQDEQVKSLAYKVAIERATAEVNISEFIYNVNLGRSIIFQTLEEIDLSVKSLQPIINKINFYFDQFIYYAVFKYTELTTLQIQDKSLFIEQSHKDRLTLLGQMSSSFVHEFRNPLTAVMGFVKLLKEDDQEVKYIDIISHELEQLNFRISQFLLASRRDTNSHQQKEDFDIKVLIDEIIEFVYPSIADGDVVVVTEIGDRKTVKGYREEIRQVFINLIMNSIDALRTNEGKKQITIKTNVASEKEIDITVSNNGPAIPNHVQKTIFEPFFTTKELGTGIGLYVSKKIIEKHNGKITCFSNDEITTFTVTLHLE